MSDSNSYPTTSGESYESSPSSNLSNRVAPAPLRNGQSDNIAASPPNPQLSAPAPPENPRRHSTTGARGEETFVNARQFESVTTQTTNSTAYSSKRQNRYNCFHKIFNPCICLDSFGCNLFQCCSAIAVLYFVQGVGAFILIVLVASEDDCLAYSYQDCQGDPNPMKCAQDVPSRCRALIATYEVCIGLFGLTSIAAGTLLLLALLGNSKTVPKFSLAALAVMAVNTTVNIVLNTVEYFLHHSLTSANYIGIGQDFYVANAVISTVIHTYFMICIWALYVHLTAQVGDKSGKGSEGPKCGYGRPANWSLLVSPPTIHLPNDPNHMTPHGTCPPMKSDGQNQIGHH